MTPIPPEALRLAEGAADGCLDDLYRMLNTARTGKFFLEPDLLEFLRSIATSVMEAAAPKISDAERERIAKLMAEQQVWMLRPRPGETYPAVSDRIELADLLAGLEPEPSAVTEGER